MKNNIESRVKFDPLTPQMWAAFGHGGQDGKQVLLQLEEVTFPSVSFPTADTGARDIYSSYFTAVDTSPSPAPIKHGESLIPPHTQALNGVTVGLGPRIFSAPESLECHRSKWAWLSALTLARTLTSTC